MTSDDGNLFLVLRIATGAVRPRNDMFFARGAVQARFQVVREADPCAPIDLRRAASPHAALRQTQRFPPSRQASTSAERVADGDAETMRKQGANSAVLSSRGWIVPDLAVSCPRKGFQNHWFWRRSFFPFFRRRKKGSRRRQDRSREVRIATGAVRPRNDMVFCMRCGASLVSGRPGGRPLCAVCR